MNHRLENLRIEEVSLVTKPANQHAKVVLIKHAITGDSPMTPEEKARFEKMEADYNGLTASLTKANADLAAAHEAIAKLNAASADVVLFKNFRDGLPEVLRGPFDSMDGEMKKNFMDRYNSGASTDPITKTLAELVGQMQKQNEANSDLRDRLAKHEQAASLVAVKAEIADLSGIPDFETVAKTVMDLRAAGQDDLAKRTIEIQRAAVARAKGADIFRVIGKNGTGAGSPEDRLDTIAKSIQDKMTGITYAKAYAMATEQNPGIYAEIQPGRVS